MNHFRMTSVTDDQIRHVQIPCMRFDSNRLAILGTVSIPVRLCGKRDDLLVSQVIKLVIRATRLIDIVISDI